MSRKTPIRHEVNGYTTKHGMRVPGYMRGSGTRITKARSSVLVTSKEEIISSNIPSADPTAYRIIFHEDGGKTRPYYVVGHDYADAIREAYKKIYATKAIPQSISLYDFNKKAYVKIPFPKLDYTYSVKYPERVISYSVPLDNESIRVKVNRSVPTSVRPPKDLTPPSVRRAMNKIRSGK